MSNWKRELWDIIKTSLPSTDSKEFESDLKKSESGIIEKVTEILSRENVRNELKCIDEWKEGEDVVHLAAAAGYEVVLTKLLDSGANPNAYVRVVGDDGDIGKFTPLSPAVLKDQMSSVILLIRYGANENLEAIMG